MRILLLSLFVLLMSAQVCAENIFPEKELKDLRVVETNIDEDVAWISDSKGNEAEALIGDSIGIEGGIVTEIDKASIIIRIDNAKTKMLVTHGVLMPQGKHEEGGGMATIGKQGSVLDIISE